MEIKPQILFEDNDILVIDKPAGMIVSRADTTKRVLTVQEWAEQLTTNNEQLTTKGDLEFAQRGGVVHRLDKETSGVLVLAKNEESFNKLKTQFKDRTVKKTYIALLHGELLPAEGEINVPIGRLPWNRIKFGFLPEGREAQTLYKVLSIKYFESKKIKEPLSLVEVYPQTGRTHQIRVHMRYVNHPVFADELYAGRKAGRADREILPRHFLHAAKISLNHPKTGEKIAFESPLPADLANFLAKLS